MSMKKPLLTFVVDRTASEDEPNPFGWDAIHVWYFNFDGEGSALVTFDEERDFESLYGNDLYRLLCGDPGSGVRWYKRAPNANSS